MVALIQFEGHPLKIKDEFHCIVFHKGELSGASFVCKSAIAADETMGASFNYKTAYLNVCFNIIHRHWFLFLQFIVNGLTLYDLSMQNLLES